MKILVIGIHTRHITCSARRAGHTVYSLSYFDDVDVKTCSSGSMQLESATNRRPDPSRTYLERLVPAVRKLLPVDHIVLGPGFELYGDWIRALTGKEDILLNNPSRIMADVSDKLCLADKLISLGIPHPHTVPLDSITAPEQWHYGYPAIIKPRIGAGGINNISVRDKTELANAITAAGDRRVSYLLQQYIHGTVASASLISTGDRAAVIAVNEQLTGAGTNMPFAYCGNITPYDSGHNSWICETAVNLAVGLHLIGTNGIDFIITEAGPMVLEINPRFQGSIDTVEHSTGINLFQAHYNSFLGLLPATADHRCTSVKMIYFAPRKFIISAEVYDFLNQCLQQGNAADVPPEGTVIEKDEPAVTFIADGHDRETAVRMAENLAGGLAKRIKKTANTED